MFIWNNILKTYVILFAYETWLLEYHIPFFEKKWEDDLRSLHKNDAWKSLFSLLKSWFCFIVEYKLPRSQNQFSHSKFSDFFFNFMTKLYIIWIWISLRLQEEESFMQLSTFLIKLLLWGILRDFGPNLWISWISRET